MARRSRSVSAEERTLWENAIRDAKPLAGQERRPAANPPPAIPEAEPAGRATPPVPTAEAPVRPLLANLDRRSAQRLKKGEVQLDARLDLHGHTHAAAHVALQEFLSASRSAGHRWVLVITGKGLVSRRIHGRDHAVLRDLVPRWLAEPAFRRHVVSFHEAAPRHGGVGALYVLLRRDRSEDR